MFLNMLKIWWKSIIILFFLTLQICNRKYFKINVHKSIYNNNNNNNNVNLYSAITIQIYSTALV